MEVEKVKGIEKQYMRLRKRKYNMILDVALDTMSKTETLTYIDLSQIYALDPICCKHYFLM
ncbi:MAG: hypothetical protein QXL89_04765 [Nitrososphaeria archaeon]